MPAKIKGHWKSGRARNTSGMRWAQVRRAALRTLAMPRRGVVSRRMLAKRCGVDERIVRRWLAEVDRPDQAMVDRISEWVEDVR